MDVNGTRFHLLLTRDDWVGKDGHTGRISRSGSPPEDDLFWDEGRCSLGLSPLLFQFPTPPGDEPLLPESRRGAGCDRYGNWYWIAESGTEIRMLPSAGHQPEHFWSADDVFTACESPGDAGAFRPLVPSSRPAPLQLSGLAVTEGHYLVAGVLAPAGVLIFDLHAGGAPVRVVWPQQVPFAPFDVAPAPDGGVWILDRAGRYWALDRYFRVIAAGQAELETDPPTAFDFRPVTGPAQQRPGRVFPAGIALDMASPVVARHPLSIEGLPDGTVLILEAAAAEAYSVLSRYRFGRQLGPSVPLDRVLESFVDAQSVPEIANPYALQGHDMAFLPAASPGPGMVAGTLYIAASAGNQSFAFDLEASETHLSLTLQPRYYPMRLYSGKALVPCGQAVYYDLQECWLELAELPRPRYRPSGALETRVFDGEEPDCIWHRLFLDACIPPGTEVAVESRAANSESLLAQTSWYEEPRLYLREGRAELPYYSLFSAEERERDGTGTWELLLQRARGRYLQLRLGLRGTGRSTPWLRALRVYYPRFSYLKEYLPAAYRDDEPSAWFLDRFLANIEGMYTALEGRIAQAQVLFDVRTVPTEYLDWLAGWLGVVLDPAWEEKRRRLFLSHAHELYRQRGTLAGLIRAVRLAVDPCPDETLFGEGVVACSAGNAERCGRIDRYSVRIVERFLTRSAPSVVYGDPGQVEGPGVTTGVSSWQPEQGAEPLHAQFRNYLSKEYQNDIDALNEAWTPGTPHSGFEEILLSPVRPANAASAEDWRRFTQVELGFTYAPVEAADKEAYQSFLARRYQHVDRLKAAYQLDDDGLTVFGEADLPAEDDMPSGGDRLYDWIQFVSLVLPIRQSAHRFSVLVPVDLQSDLVIQEQQVDLVRRIVEIEKPAHTDFDVRPYWALFRVGEARLGLDTLLDMGSRFVALVLGKGYVARSHLAHGHPWNVGDRIVSNRDRIDSARAL